MGAHNYIESIFLWIAHEWYVPLIFCAMLAALFFWGLFHTYSLVNHAKRLLLRASKVIKDSAPESDPAKFYEQFDAIDNALLDITEFKSLWREFSESTFRDHEDKLVCLSRRPGEYFKTLTIISNKGNIRQVQSVPNYLIGLGLFFTFLGLAAALHIAQGGLGDGNIQAQQDALKGLLSTASVKFISSLVAILLSLILSIWQRHLFNAYQRALGSFCNLIEERTEFLPSEKLLVQTLSEQKRQTAFQADMAMNIADKLGGILAKSLPESVAAALEPLAEEIRDLAKKFSGSNENALQQVLQEFIGQLRQSSGQDMDALIGSIQTLKSSLEILVDNIQGLSSNFGHETKESTARLTRCLEEFTQTFTPVQQGLGQFGQALSVLGDIAGKIEQAGGNMTGAATTNQQAASSLAAVVHDASEQISPIRNALQDLQIAMQSISGTAEKIVQAGNQMDSAATSLQQSASEIGKSQNNFADKMQNFTQATDKVATTISTLERASSQVGSALQPLQVASQGVSSAAESIRQTEARIQDAQQQLSSMMEKTTLIIQKIPAVLESYEEKFGKVDAELSAAFDQLTKGSSEFRSSVEGFVNTLDDSFARALNGLSGAVDKMTAEREEFFNEPRQATG